MFRLMIHALCLLYLSTHNVAGHVRDEASDLTSIINEELRAQAWRNTPWIEIDTKKKGVPKNLLRGWLRVEHKLLQRYCSAGIFRDKEDKSVLFSFHIFRHLNGQAAEITVVFRYSLSRTRTNLNPTGTPRTTPVDILRVRTSTLVQGTPKLWRRYQKLCDEPQL